MSANVGAAVGFVVREELRAARVPGAETARVIGVSRATLSRRLGGTSPITLN